MRDGAVGAFIYSVIESRGLRTSVLNASNERGLNTSAHPGYWLFSIDLIFFRAQGLRADNSFFLFSMKMAKKL